MDSTVASWVRDIAFSNDPNWQERARRALLAKGYDREQINDLVFAMTFHGGGDDGLVMGGDGLVMGG